MSAFLHRTFEKSGEWCNTHTVVGMHVLPLSGATGVKRRENGRVQHLVPYQVVKRIIHLDTVHR